MQENNFLGKDTGGTNFIVKFRANNCPFSLETEAEFVV